MDSDDLLVEEDLLKPDPATLRSKKNLLSDIKLVTRYFNIITHLS
jgi:hypothetical protein